MDNSEDARLQLARTLLKSNAYSEAAELLHSLTAEQPGNASAWFLLGACQHQSGQLTLALNAFSAAINISPLHIQALSARAQVLFELGAWLDSLQHYEQLTQLDPENPTHWLHCSVVLDALGLTEDALTYLDSALAINQQYRDALINKANLLLKQKRHPQALEIYNRLLLAQPNDATLLANRADIYLSRGDLTQAMTDLKAALSINPDMMQAQLNYCITLASMGYIKQADKHFEELKTKGLTKVLESLHWMSIELPVSGQFIDFMTIYLWVAYKRQEICNWTDRQRLVELYDAVADGRQQLNIYPGWMMFALMSLPVKDITRLQLAKKVAHNYRTTTDLAASSLEKSRIPAKDSSRPLNIAYIGSNFHDHPNYYLTRDLYAEHNRDRVNVSIYVLNPKLPSHHEQHLNQVADRCRNLSALSDMDIAKTIADDEIDILIDLCVYNNASRPGILALRPAPLQISWLGSEVSSGAEYIDYRISDKFLTSANRDLWSEKLINLPGTCFPYASTQKINYSRYARADYGLPENAFVFCSFNNSYKIEPLVFASWCRILNEVDNSVLWLFVNDNATQVNLRAHAKQNGIDPARLIFAQRIPHEAHLARHRLADLFLDTMIYNAHTTAIESLWTGLPLITVFGIQSASRVAASILKAAGMDELVTDNTEAYETLAIKLATDAAYYSQIRQSTLELRDNSKIFDGTFFARKLEAAYDAVWQQYIAQKQPKDIEISNVEAS